MSQSGANLPEAARLLRDGRPGEALSLLQPAISGADVVGPAHTLYLSALIALGDRMAANAALDAALKLKTASEADAFDALAFYARELDRHELSNTLYKQAAELAPKDLRFWYNLATSDRSLGRLAEAATACERALALDPDLRPAILLRSEVTRATRAANHVDDLSARIAASADDGAASFLLYALGKELHELERYDEAFAAFARGAAGRRASLRYDVAQDELKLRRIAEAFPTASPHDAEAPIGRHIFIVGLPRSGTTLTERILGGLPNVRSNNETNNFSTALLKWSPAGGGDVFDRAAHADFAAVAREYDALAAGDGFAGKIIEKLPFNYLYVGAILRAFPTTPVVWVRRDPLDTCFAMFRTLFGAAYPFSYDFEELARYYGAYEKLMRHWAGLFPERLIRVDYEELVAAPDVVSPALARRCGLAWSDRALDITANRSASLTASAAQVRQGIHTASSGMWRKYRRHLEPLVRGLAASGVAVAADGDA